MNGFTFPPPPPPPPRPSKPQEESRSTGPGHTRQPSEAYRNQGAPRGRGSGRGGLSHGFPQGLPRGAHFNPNFQPQSQRQSGNEHIDNRRGSIRPNVSEQQQHITQQQTQPYPDRTPSAHKRKLDALRGPPLNNEARSGPQVAPAVPRFGAPVISKDSGVLKFPSASTTAVTSTPGRSLFGIGNPQTGPADSDSSNDDQEDELDEDEEAMYAQLGTKLVFEYEGNVVSLANEADLAQWQQERRSRFPTIQRVAAKDAERRVVGAERKRLLDGAYALGRPSWARRPLNPPTAPTTVEEQHAANELIDPAAPTTVGVSTDLLGMNQYDSDEEDDGNPEAVREDDEKPALDGSDDEAPEETSSKPPAVDSRPACKYYFSTGACKAGDGCQFRHEAQVGQPLDNVRNPVKKQMPKRARSDKSRKKGIFELLTDQENEAADKLALQVIEHLGSIGFFKA